MGTKGWEQYENIPVDEAFDHGKRFGLSDHFGSTQQRCSIIRFDPGEGGPLHYHEEPIEEYYFVLAGKLDIRIGEDRVSATPGTVLFTPSGTPHQPQNNSDRPADLLSVIAPKSAYDESASGMKLVEE